MINFRFHVVSLIAIFLALALGVVIGAGVIDRGVVDTLNSRLDRVESRSEQIRDENDALTTRNEQLDNAVVDIQPFAVDERLFGDDFAIVAVRGVDGDRVSALVTAAQQADATVPGVLWLEDKWSLDKDDAIKALQDAIGSTTKNKTTLRQEGWQLLARRLSTSNDVAPAQDPLVALQQAGFLGYDAVSQSAISGFPGRGAAIALAVGNKGSVDPILVSVPLSKVLHSAGLPTVVAGSWAKADNGPDRAAAVQDIRNSTELAATVSTVDDLDLAEGPLTVVLAMSDLLRTPPVVGHYGYGKDAKPIPDLVSP
jgi:hypothetical protein